MFDKAAKHTVSAQVLRKIREFRSDEGGSIAVFVLFLFVVMILVGGISVDVMRSEMRRVAYQQTIDRAVLAASNVVLPPSQSPIDVCNDWYAKSGLKPELTVNNVTPTCTGLATTSSREAKATGKVRSYNWFMHMLNQPYFEIPVETAAQQGVSKIEVIMALDITGSMAEASGTTTKIAALRQAASNFVTILKYSKDAGGNYTINKDPNNLISVGMVPYSSNVNIPVALRNQFNVTNISWWDYLPNKGVPKINCLEIQPSTFGSMALSTADPIPAAAVASITASAISPTFTAIGTTVGNATNGGVIVISPTAPVALDTNNSSFGNIMCNHGDNPNTSGVDESASNLLLVPTTDISTVKAQISQLNPRGNTSIAIGMRWATAMIDETARPIYTAIRGGETAMNGRPANNSDNDTRKIIVLMTDGTHVASKHILDTYKSGTSPIWRGADGNLAIRFNGVGHTMTGGTRPGINPNGVPAPVNSCSGWDLSDKIVNGVTVRRDVFVPHLKAASVKRKVGATEAEGSGTGTSVSGGCDPRAWVALSGNPATPSWPGSGTVRNLDWSEVWRYATVDWVVEQLFMRSNVTGATTYTNVYNTFVGDYLVNAANMDSLLNTNCTAAKTAGVEVFGIILGDSVTEGPIKNCSSPGTGYYYKVTNADDLNATFEQIAVLISDLRLTQ